MAPDLPTLDVVVPMSHMWLMPYLRNCIRSVFWQDYPRERINVVISYMYSDEEDLSELFEFCKEHELALVFRKLRAPAFNICRTKNVGIRHGSSQWIALIDADVVLHPRTFSVAAPLLLEGRATVIPVGRMEERPESPIFSEEHLDRWERYTNKAPFRRDGVGNIIVARSLVELVRGYDERLHGWGGADTDLHKRLITAQCKVVNLIDHGCPKAMHQSHRLTPTRESQFTRRNRTIIAQSPKAIRNPGGWGDVLDSE